VQAQYVSLDSSGSVVTRLQARLTMNLVAIPGSAGISTPLGPDRRWDPSSPVSNGDNSYSDSRRAVYHLVPR
jgi:hypothetical protein